MLPAILLSFTSVPLKPDFPRKDSINIGNIGMTGNLIYNPALHITFNQDYDVGHIKNDGLIGVHGRIIFKTLGNLETLVIRKFTNYYAPSSGIRNISTGNFTPTSNVDFATSIKYDTIVFNNIANLISIPNYQILTEGMEPINKFQYTRNPIYSPFVQQQVSLDCVIDQELTAHQNLNWAVGEVAQVCVIQCTYYESHDYWWNHNEEIIGTRVNASLHIIQNPQFGIVYQNGTYAQR